MANKVYCPVCQVSFIHKETLTPGQILLCPVCAAKVEIVAVGPPPESRKLPQNDRDEIYERVENYAKLKKYVFNENKEMIMEGLMEKKAAYGDFFCPCRFDNIPENICPCLETRMGYVRKEGSCL